VSRRGWQIAFALACVVNVLVLYSPESGPSNIPYADKLVPVLVLNAAVSELVQHYWLSQRSGDVFDAVADVAGVALGVWLATGRRTHTT
jgi:hypothetical protein